MIKDFILEYDNFYSKQECVDIINFYDKADRAGYTMQRQDYSETTAHQIRDTSCSLNHYNYDFTQTSTLSRHFLEKFWQDAYAKYIQQYSIIDGMSPHKIYSMKIQKTKPGEGYHIWHSECGSRLHCMRFLSFILFLNTIEDGGETEFLYYSKRIKAEEGKLIIFPGNFTHTHRGNQPLTEEKYIVTGWVELDI